MVTKENFTTLFCNTNLVYLLFFVADLCFPIVVTCFSKELGISTITLGLCSLWHSSLNSFLFVIASLYVLDKKIIYSFVAGFVLFFLLHNYLVPVFLIAGFK